jgi:hypothetical protein
MKNGSTPCVPLAQQRQSERASDGLRWIVGSAITALAVGLVMFAVVCAPANIRANNDGCLQQIANEEHTSLEAFFENPAQQDAFVQAVTVCSR